ncbi:thioesterase II family protein [Streptomyces sp. NPDC057302]|uniref:thioesterase II family protein n=1 Tax=Streptomyces sp. NPDC057302 TaxID=3346094 RepID=UPI003644D8D8
MNLLCFHHAGAGAMTFAGWQRHVGPDVKVLPVRLPGRESRLREERITEGTRLVEELEHDLGPLLDERPHAFYGHSLGALVAYRFALHRAQLGRRPPHLLLVGACAAPQLPSALLDATGAPGLSDEQLIASLNDEESMPQALLSRPEWLSMTLDTLRADLQLARSLRCAPITALSCAVRAFAGTGDQMVPAADIQAWEHCTTAGFALHSVPGAHFFVRGHHAPSAVAEALGERAPHTGAPLSPVAG